MTALTLTLIGRDRPGLVSSLSACVAAAGGNWLESRMARLAGHFAGILLVDVPEAEVDRLVAELSRWRARGCVPRSSAASARTPEALDRSLLLELIGQDRPGIVRDVTQVLATPGQHRGTDHASGQRVFSGERLFEAQARLRVPADVPDEELREALETLANELMVDLKLDHMAG